MSRGLGILVALFCAVVSNQVFARTSAIAAYDGYVAIESGISLYARVTPGSPDAPVIVLLNGLTQDLDFWNTTVPYLISKNANVVQIDLALQGRSMVKRLDEYFTVFNPVVPPLVLHGGLWDLEPTFPETTVQDQSRYVSVLLKKLGITQPAVLVGLSYGGGLALQMAADYPDQVGAAILAAPYVFPLPDQDQLIKTMVTDLRQAYPQWNSVSYDDAYDLILRGLVDSTYADIEPEILKWRPPFGTIGAAELVRGIRHLSYSQLLDSSFHVSLHLIMAGADQYIPADKLEEFWSNVPERVRGSYLKIQGVEHKMNESVGPYFGSWVWEVASNPDYVVHPGRFIGVPQDGVATEDGGLHRTVQLQKAIPRQLPAPPTWPGDRIRRDPFGYLTSIVNAANPLPSSP